MHIAIKRLMSNLHKVGEIGNDPSGGITRLAFSKEYKEASEILINLMEESNLEVNVDPLHNVIGKRLGKNKKLPSIIIGSHLDTVKNGGLYDGNLGVAAGLECLKTLNDNNIETNHTIELISFNAEEGGKVGGTFGSRVMTGLQCIEEPGLEENIKNYNITINDLKNTLRNTNEIKCYLEMHVEQGAYLYEEDIPIGIVDGIVGITRYSVSCIGQANHAGTTPMSLRKDALVGTSKLIIKINELAKKMGDPFVATVGTINIKPDFVSIIPGECNSIIEIRGLSQKRIEQFMEKVISESKLIPDSHFTFNHLLDKSPVYLNKSIINSLEKVCKKNNIKYKIMSSGAGHDAKPFAKKVPTGMIFVPSVNGISHSPKEFTKQDDIEKGANVLLNTILDLDKNI